MSHTNMIQLKHRRNLLDDSKSKKKDEKKADNLMEMLSEKKEYVTDGKFLKAVLNQEEKTRVNNFVDSFVDEKDPSKDQIKAAKKILQIGKTFYEFASGESALIPLFISHETYDKLLTAFKKYETEPESFIPKKMFDKIDIKYKTLSNNLDKAYRISDEDPIPTGVAEKDSVERFLKDSYDELGLSKNDELEIECSVKVDGVSVNSGIKDGELRDPGSRGDKEKGIYIKSLEGFKMADAKNSTFGIQYEAFVTKKNRKEVSAMLGLDKDYATNRSAASALIGRMARSNSPELAKFLSFYPIATEGLDKMDYKERMEYIEKFGIIPHDMIPRTYFKGTRKELLDEIKHFFKAVEKQRDSLSFAIDGIVITVVKDKYQEKLGRDGSTNNFQIALKFDPSEAIAVVKDVVFSEGNLGYKTIMLEFEQPVLLNGSTYPKVHVLSLETFESLDLHRGDEVKVKLTGDVIPTVVIDSDCKRGPGLVKLELSKICYTCSKPLVIDNGKHRCVNPNCKSNVTGRIAHFFERINLEGFDRAAAEDFYEKLDVRSLKDLFKLEELDLEEIGYNKRAKKFVKGIREAMKDMKDYELLGALGLDGIRDETSKKILKVVDIDNIPKYDMVDLIDALKQVRGIDKLAASYARSLLQCADEIFYLLQFIDKKRTDFNNTKTVGFTGIEMSDTVKAIIRAKGWTHTDGKKFDYLITSSYKRGSGKMTKAQDNNIPIYTETDFIKEFGDGVVYK